jgi:DNA-binding NtrC family response regulator
MVPRTVALIALSPELQRAFRSYAADRGMRVLDREGDIALAVTTHRLALCVVELGGSDSRVVEQVRSLAKVIGPSPLVVLARNLGAGVGARLIRLGVADVIDLPSPVDDVVATAFQSCGTGEDFGVADPIVGESAAIVAVRQRLQSVARTPAMVLIVGETGTGKGLVARAIHDLSDRAAAPFVHVDCAALPPSVIESELFGHERGAFTGAAEQRRGRFELAERGTLLLDEIGDLELPVQSKLLRVLQHREYERVGGSRTLRVDARIIAATNVDLWSAVQRGAFRRDLFFRLNVFEIRMPALRERKEDIALIARAGLEKLAASLGVAAPRASDGFYRRLVEHDWPGNVRELHNVLERLLIERRVAVLEAEDLDDVLPEASEAWPSADEVADPEAEARRIARVLVEVGGNVSRATRRLAMPRTTLRRRIELYKLGHLIPKD